MFISYLIFRKEPTSHLLIALMFWSYLSPSLAQDGIEIGQVQQAIGGDCGSYSSAANTVATKTVVPDHFPFDSPAGLLFAPVVGHCALFGVANFGPSCTQHDMCYETDGVTQTECDDELLSNWKKACNRVYGINDGWDTFVAFVSFGTSADLEHSCRLLCHGATEVMIAAVRGGGGSAFEAAQEGASMDDEIVIGQWRSSGNDNQSIPWAAEDSVVWSPSGVADKTISEIVGEVNSIAEIGLRNLRNLDVAIMTSLFL